MRDLNDLFRSIPMSVEGIETGSIIPSMRWKKSDHAIGSLPILELGIYNDQIRIEWGVVLPTPKPDLLQIPFDTRFIPTNNRPLKVRRGSLLKPFYFDSGMITEKNGWGKIREIERMMERINKKDGWMIIEAYEKHSVFSPINAAYISKMLPLRFVLHVLFCMPAEEKIHLL